MPTLLETPSRLHVAGRFSMQAHGILACGAAIDRGSIGSFARKITMKTDWIIALGRLRPAYYAGVYFAFIPIFAGIFAFAPDMALKCGTSACSGLEALYFSVVTITTLGYGDVTPSGSSAQAAAGLEALLGIVTIGLFLNSLSYAISSSAQKAEAETQKRAQYSAELSRMRSFYSIVQIYLSRYKLYAYLVTTPFEKRPGVQVMNESGPIQLEVPKDAFVGDLSTLATTDFSMNDLRDLFRPSLMMSDDHKRPCVSYYFEAQDDLVQAIREFMQGADLNRWPQLSIICKNLIENSIKFDWRDAILNWPSIPMGNSSGESFIRQTLAEWDGAPKFQHSNVMNAFVALHFLIKNNLENLSLYEQKVQSALETAPLPDWFK
ncbi:two pore domain potassium channel family protein [Paraburkholderia aspalathi]|nr:two pore domain potassium channel family protein [Paraburkholderia aspalathi]